MAESKHTPGGWRVDEYSIPERGGSRIFIRCEQRHWAIGSAYETHGCTDPELDVPQPEARANAHMFAASSKMFEALHELADAIDDGLCNSGAPGFDGRRLDRALVASRAALAKARGEAA